MAPSSEKPLGFVGQLMDDLGRRLHAFDTAALMPHPRRSIGATAWDARKWSNCGWKKVWSQHQPCTNTNGGSPCPACS